MQNEMFTMNNDNLLQLEKRLGNSSTIKEVLHLVMRLLRPRDDLIKYDMNLIKKNLLSDSMETSGILEHLCYSNISSRVYREVDKRFKLWKIDEITDEKLQPFIKFLKKSLNFLKIRENQLLFRNMNEFYSVIQQ